MPRNVRGGWGGPPGGVRGCVFLGAGPGNQHSLSMAGPRAPNRKDFGNSFPVPALGLWGTKTVMEEGLQGAEEDGLRDGVTGMRGLRAAGPWTL